MQANTARVSSPFGPRSDGQHRGIDFASIVRGRDYSGAPIYAAADGIVVEGADRANVSGFGNWVWIDHQDTPGPDGKPLRVDTISGHMRRATILVAKGDVVKRGQKIAEVGANGNVSGAHLHFEVWDKPGRDGGRPLNPAPLLGLS